MRKSLTWLIGMVLLVGACTNNGATTTTDTLGSVGGTTATTATSFGTSSGGDLLPGLFASALQEFDSCDAFLAHIKAEAIERVGAYGLPGFGYYGGPVFALAETEAAFDDVGAAIRDRAVAQTSAPVAGQDFSTTNVQEVGVDDRTSSRPTAIASWRSPRVGCTISTSAPAIPS